MFITISGWYMSPLQGSTTLTQCRFNVYPPSPAPAYYSMLGSVLCWCQCINRAHTDRTQRRLNVGPSFIQHRAVHFTHDTRTQCLLNVGPLSVTPEQHWTSIVGLSQRMSTRRKIYTLRLHVSSATQKHGAFNPKDGLMLRKWRE